MPEDNDDQQQNQQGKGPVDLVAKAKEVINKARREQAQNKITELVKKQAEAVKTVNLIQAEIDQVANDYAKGL